MAAGVHLAGDLAGVFQPRDLLHRKRIHIRTQTNRWSLALSVDHGHNTTLGPACGDLIDAKFLQSLHNKSRRLMALTPQFGVHMNMPPPCLHLVSKPRNTVDHSHRSSPYLCSVSIRRAKNEAPIGATSSLKSNSGWCTDGPSPWPKK